MRNKYLLTVLVNLMFSGLLFGQRTLNLEKCRDLAIENNKSLRIATIQERVAFYQKKEAFSKYLPSFDATGAYVRLQDKFNLFPESVTIPPIGSLPSIELPIPESLGEIDLRNIFIGSLSLTQPIFMGGRIIAYNDIMRNAELLAKQQKDSKLQDVIAEIDAAYWQVVSLAWKENLASSYVALLKKIESDVKIMNEEGVATKADVLTVSVKVNEGEMALTKVQNGLSLSRMLLNQLCGLDINESVKLADENNELVVITEENVLPDMEDAVNNRSEIKSLELLSKINKGQEKLALAEFLPQAGIRLGYTWMNPNIHHGFEKKFHGGWNIAVSLKIPFNFGMAPKLNAAKANTLISQMRTEDAKQKIELQINQSTFKLSEARKQLAASEKNLDKADENLRYAKVGFDEGVISASEVLGAHTAWLEAHSAVIDSRIDVKLSHLYLDKALGRSLYPENKKEEEK